MLHGISIHVPREGHDLYVNNIEQKILKISIHVPREGHDVESLHGRLEGGDISIHVPREGHDRAFFLLIFP